MPGPDTSAAPRVGIVGAGQLARMTYEASVRLDLSVTVLAAHPDDAAVRAGAPAIIGAPDSLEALTALAERCDVLTFDHEVIPPAHLEALVEDGRRLLPPPRANLLAQDKARQRAALSALGVPVPAHRLVREPRDLEAFGESLGWPVVAKAVRGGYDGRGVWVVSSPEEAREVVERARAEDTPLLAEQWVDVERELAVLVARREGGECVVYPVVETVQADGMMRELVAPAPVDGDTALAATTLARQIAHAVGAVGILAVELFQARPGGGLLVNELALRPHNSGHWTIEGAVTSQFENHLRAVVGWPLGAPDALTPAAATVNVIGPADGSDPARRLPQALTISEARFHLYGKAPRPGRKLGHVTVTGQDPAGARAAARRAVSILAGEEWK
jgi:5-(carboxyamino)imidazole ribonucleotide synthase